MTKGRIRGAYYLLTGLFWFSSALVVSLYVLYIMGRGLDLAQVGLWGGVNTAAVLLLEVPTGGLADAWGRGRTFALANLVIGASMALMAFVPAHWALFLGAGLFGAGRALSSGSLDAWFVDAVKAADPEVDVEKELGPAGAVTLAAVAGGSVLGALLPGWLGRDGGPFGLPALAWPLLADVVLKGLTAVLALALVREEGRHGSPWKALGASVRAVPSMIGSVGGVVRGKPAILFLFGAGAAAAVAAGSVESFWQPRFAELGTSDAFSPVFGAVMAGCFVAGALASLLAPAVTKAFGGRRHATAILGSVLAVASLAALSRSGGRGAVAACMAAVYFSCEGIHVPRKALLNDSVPAELRSTMLSVDSMASYLGFALVMGLGLVARSRGIPTAWIAAAALALPGMGFMALHAASAGRSGAPAAVAPGEEA